MKALLAVILLVLTFLSSGPSCARRDRDDSTAPARAERGRIRDDAKFSTADASRRGKKTAFERMDGRRSCPSNPALCEGDFFEVDIKKSVETDLNPADPANGPLSEFCLGGCSKKSLLQWSLEW